MAIGACENDLSVSSTIVGMFLKAPELGSDVSGKPDIIVVQKGNVLTMRNSDSCIAHSGRVQTPLEAEIGHGVVGDNGGGLIIRAIVHHDDF
jgi:hypothetical protein